MIVQNHTPFAPQVSAGVDVFGRMFGVLVLRGTFRIVPGAPLQPHREQAPVLVSDVFHGDPTRSSLRVESDLAPFKPRADICVNAVAHAPGGWSEPSWLVRVRVGRLEKALRITGPRRWVREGGTYRLTEPEACAEVPIRYERAFGGIWRDGQPDADVLEENPTGVGHVPAGERPTEPEIDAPQIESPDDPIDAIGQRHRPEGLGPICRAWLPRRALAGTYDERWQRERWPFLPHDFDPAFFNCAHPGLVYPGYLSGDEEVVLEGMSPAGEIRFSLPGYEAMAIIGLNDGSRSAGRLRLDTLVIDVPEGRVTLVWRAQLPRPEDIRVVEARMFASRGDHRVQ